MAANFSKMSDRELELAAVELQRRRVKRAHEHGVNVMVNGDYCPRPADSVMNFSTPYGNLRLEEDDGDYNAFLEGKFLDAPESDEEYDDVVEFVQEIQHVLSSKDRGELAQRSLEFIQKYKDLLDAAAVQKIIEE